MLNNKPASARVRAIGLVSSLVAVASIGLTLLADNGSLGFGKSITRSGRVSLLFIAVAICIIHILLRLTRQPLGKRRDPKCRSINQL
jgi:hypothetical protein